MNRHRRIGLLVLLFCLLSASAAYAMITGEESPSPTISPSPMASPSPKASPKTSLSDSNNYLPNSLIVAFKSDDSGSVADMPGSKKYLKSCAHCIQKMKKKFKDHLSDGSNSIDDLYEKHKVWSTRSLFRTEIDEMSILKARGGSDPLSIQDIQELRQNKDLKIKLKNPKRAHRSPKKNVRSSPLDNVYQLEVPPGSNIHDVIRDFSKDAHIEYVEPVGLGEFADTYEGLDPYYNSKGSWGQTQDDLWWIKKVRAPEAWKDRKRGDGIVVAVVDSGVDHQHPDLIHSVWKNEMELAGKENVDDDDNGYVDDIYGWNFFENNNDVVDTFGHGTFVAGIVAATGDNNEGIVGVAPHSKILSVRGSDANGTVVIPVMANAIIYAVDNGADVINNSWGCTTNCLSNRTLENAIHYANDHGAVLVFSAGNIASNVAYSVPMNMRSPKPIVVAASNSLDKKSAFSNYGFLVDVFAPGGGDAAPPTLEPTRSILSIKSTITSPTVDGNKIRIVDQDYLRLAGTSFSAPIVAGTAALMLSNDAHAENPSLALTHEDIRMLLKANSDPMADTTAMNKSAAGRLNAAELITKSKQDVVHAKISEPSGLIDARIDPSLKEIQVRGYAFGLDFASYELSYGSGDLPTTYTPIHSSTTPVESMVLGQGGILATWKIADLSEGAYVLKLSVKNKKGKEVSDFMPLKKQSRNKVIDPDSANKMSLDVDKLRVVYTKSFSPPNIKEDVFLHDMSTRVTRAITSHGLGTMHPKISGNRIIWTDSRSGKPELYSYDLATSKEQRISTLADDQNQASLSGHRAVYVDVRQGNRNIYLYDFSSQTENPITVEAGNYHRPLIDRDFVVWQVLSDLSDTTFNSDIYFYDLDQKGSSQWVKKREVVMSDISKKNIALRGDKLIYAAGGKIHSYDLAINQAQEYSLPADECDINSNYLLYTTISGAGSTVGRFYTRYDIFLYSLQTKISSKLNVASEITSRPALSDSHAFWTGSDGPPASLYEIFYDTLPMQEIAALKFVPMSSKVIGTNQELFLKLNVENPSEHAGLRYSILSAPAGATLDSVTGYFRWRPSENQTGTHVLKFMVLDDKKNTATSSFSVRINRPPVVVATSNLPAKAKQPVLFQIQASDPDGDRLQYSAISLPESSSFDQTNGLFTWTPYNRNVGVNYAVFKVSDGVNSVDTVLRVSVSTEPNVPPQISGTDLRVDAYVNKLFTLPVAAQDANLDYLTYTVSPLPQNAKISSDGLFIWRPSLEQVGIHRLTFEVKDPHGASDRKVVEIEVRSPVDTVKLGFKHAYDYVSLESRYDDTLFYYSQVHSNHLLKLHLKAIDSTSSDLTYSFTSSRTLGGARLDSKTGEFDWIPQAADIGSFSSITFEVKNLKGDVGYLFLTVGVVVAPDSHCRYPTGWVEAMANDSPNIAGEKVRHILYLRNNSSPQCSDGNIFRVHKHFSDMIGLESAEAEFFNVTIAPAETRAIEISSSSRIQYYNLQISFSPLNAPSVALLNGLIFDRLPPATPTHLTSTHLHGNQIQLLWAPSQDNVEVFKLKNLDPMQNADQIEHCQFYKVFRNGVEIASTKTHPELFHASGSFDDYTVDVSQKYVYTVQAFDAFGNPSEMSLPLEVSTASNLSQPPVLKPIGSKSVSEGKPLSFKLIATDTPGDILTYSAKGLPMGAYLDTKTGQFMWTPGLNASGKHWVAFEVRDAHGLVDSEPVLITVQDVLLKLTLSAPNAGEPILSESTYKISWNTFGHIPTVWLEIVQDGKGQGTPLLNAKISNLGYYAWKLPSHLQKNTPYRIRVIGYGVYAVSDESDQPFQVQAQVLKPPTGFMPAYFDSKKVTLIWQDSSAEEDGFILEGARSDSDTFVPLGTVAANTKTFTVIQPAPNEYQVFRIRAYSGTLGNSSSVVCYLNTVFASS